MSTNNICFHAEIRKIFIWLSLLCRALEDKGTFEYLWPLGPRPVCIMLLSHLGFRCSPLHRPDLEETRKLAAKNSGQSWFGYSLFFGVSRNVPKSNMMSEYRCICWRYTNKFYLNQFHVLNRTIYIYYIKDFYHRRKLSFMDKDTQCASIMTRPVNRKGP